MIVWCKKGLDKSIYGKIAPKMGLGVCEAGFCKILIYTPYIKRIYTVYLTEKKKYTEISLLRLFNILAV